MKKNLDYKELSDKECEICRKKLKQRLVNIKQPQNIQYCYSHKSFMKWTKGDDEINSCRVDYNATLTLEVWKEDEHEWRATIYFHCDGFDLPEKFKTMNEAKARVTDYFENSILKQGAKS
jgi:uncharacterized Rmd1/YagE family protein